MVVPTFGRVIQSVRFDIHIDTRLFLPHTTFYTKPRTNILFQHNRKGPSLLLATDALSYSTLSCPPFEPLYPPPISYMSSFFKDVRISLPRVLSFSHPCGTLELHLCGWPACKPLDSACFTFVGYRCRKVYYIVYRTREKQCNTILDSLTM